ncbi:MAG: hypothetical protein KAV87_17995, partial [Desulfobacteraceae bacterium]|nr:hypothetical protein [Desulfobacteraceae bacterium]
GGWPEFLDQALEWLEQDVTVYDMGGRAYRGLEEGAKREIASEVVRYPAGLKSEQAERIKKIILRTDNPHLRVRLFTLFWRADKDLTFQTCRDLVQDDRPWIWWPAMYSLFNRCTEKLRPFGNLPEKMQKRLILVHEAGGGSSRLFGVSSSGRDYDTVAKEAYSMLPAMFTAQLARMDSDACRGVRTVMVKHLDRELATRVMTDFLREISTEPNQRLWAGDSYYFNTCCITAYHIARHINSLYDVNIANVGKFETPENSDAIPHNISRLKQLIADTLQWYDSRSVADNESSVATEIGTVNKTVQSPFSATLPNGMTVELVGVCDIPADGKHWWAADGSPLENVFWDGTTNKEDAKDARQMVFRVRSNDSGPDLAPTASFQVHRQQQPPGSWSGAFFVSKDNQTLEELRGCSFSLHDDHPTVDISATVGYDPWETQATRSVNSDGNLMSTLTKIGILILNDPTEKNGKTAISATLLDQVKAWRFIAIDKQGKFHNSSSAFANGWDEDDENNIVRHQIFKAEFMLPLSQIDKFQFQTRQVETITFKNVSLKPNFKTDVKVDAEGAKSKTRQPVRNSISTARRYFSR